MFNTHRRNHERNLVGASLVGAAMGFLLGSLFGSHKRNSQVDKAAHWSDDMAKDLNERVDSMKDLTVDKYNQLVDDVSLKYRKLKGIKDTEVDDFVSDLKMRWDRIKDQWNSDDEA